MNHSGLKGLFTRGRFSSIGKWLLASALLFWAASLHAQTQKVIEVYIDNWKTFYPSAAFGEGDKASAWRFEDFSNSKVERDRHGRHGRIMRYNLNQPVTSSK